MADLDRRLRGGDVLVLTVLPCRDSRHVKARAVIAAADSKVSWAHDAKTRRFFVLPSVVAAVQFLLASIASARVANEYFAVDYQILDYQILGYQIPVYQILDPVFDLPLWAAILVGAISLLGLRYELQPTRTVRLLRSYWYFPPGLSLRITGRTLDKGHLAAWARARKCSGS